jgi:hypothetical protein
MKFTGCVWFFSLKSIWQGSGRGACCCTIVVLHGGYKYSGWEIGDDVGFQNEGSWGGGLVGRWR